MPLTANAFIATTRGRLQCSTLPCARMPFVKCCWEDCASNGGVCSGNLPNKDLSSRRMLAEHHEAFANACGHGELIHGTGVAPPAMKSNFLSTAGLPSGHTMLDAPCAASIPSTRAAAAAAGTPSKTVRLVPSVVRRRLAVEGPCASNSYSLSAGWPAIELGTIRRTLPSLHASRAMLEMSAASVWHSAGARPSQKDGEMRAAKRADLHA
mmetsp:Transcript_164725/g.523684  ORF Transcript_164725/g.523684 Transcript_164725/m.523684 type:complete len:210 (-) Transcript_164725:88-717(-)